MNAPETLRAEVSRRIAAATEADDRFAADITRFIRDYEGVSLGSPQSLAALAATPASREEAMKYVATGRTARQVRAYAADPQAVAEEAARIGVAPGFVRDEMLALADAVEAVAAELTPAQCWFALGLDQVLGAFPGTKARVLQGASRG